MSRLYKAINKIKNRTVKEEGLSIVELLVASVILLTVSATVATIIVTTNSQIGDTTTDTFFNNKLTIAGKTVGTTISDSQSVLSITADTLNLKIPGGNTLTFRAELPDCGITAVEYDPSDTIVKTVEVIDVLDSCNVFSEENGTITTTLAYTSEGQTYNYQTTAAPGATYETGDTGAFDLRGTSIIGFNAKFNNGQPFTFNGNITSEQTPEIQVSGTGPFTYSIHNGQLPDILTFSQQTGRTTGPATWVLTNQDYVFVTSFTVRIQDANGIAILLPITLQSPKPKPIIATGGTITEYTDDGIKYRVHTFTGVGKTPFNVTSVGNMGGTVDYLIVGGGGGGAGTGVVGGAGGGGAGGVRTSIGSTPYAVGVANYTVTVGAGGVRSNSGPHSGNNGNPSSVFNIIAYGGGGGGTNTVNGRDGSSGGGGGLTLTDGITTSGGTGISGQGNDGGRGGPGIASTGERAGGGGGGAGAAGQNGAVGTGGNGGNGLSIDISGTESYYGGGGGGGAGAGTAFVRVGTGGLGGGSNGAGGDGPDAEPNTGGGGGGGGGLGDGVNRTGGAGGSGVVIIRYPIDIEIVEPPSAPTNISTTNITDSSATITWTAPTTGGATKNYEIFLNGELYETVASNVVELEAQGLTYNTDYTVAVKSVNASGEAEATSSFKTKGFIQATGGVITQYEDNGFLYNVHTFNNVGTTNFNITYAPDGATVEYLIVGGGGGGGTDLYNDRSAGGGGAGGVISGSTSISATSYSVSVGDGGAGASGANDTNGVRGSNGLASSVFGLTALGGGGGGGHTTASNRVGLDGGSGGGGTHDVNAGPPGAGTIGQGSSGRFGNSSTNSSTAAGVDGISSSITGSTLFYGGGGAASSSGSWTGGGGGGASGGTVTRTGFLGGLGGGGSSGSGTGLVGCSSGAPNTGGGGGAAREQSACSGGSGVVIVKYVAGISAQGFIEATGGSISQIVSNGILYNVHTFTNVGTSTFNVSNAPAGARVEYLIVGGGGGGGEGRGGGGGGGGMLEGAITISAQSHAVVVGGGGLRRARGGDSSVFGVTALGGGYGGTHLAENNGVSGGSGGGASMNYSTNVSPRGGAGTAGQGNRGGNANAVSTDFPRATGGGGGAGGAGTDTFGSTSVRPNGGPGRASSISGATIFYGGGGGGARGGTDGASADFGDGGLGGGGRGGGSLPQTNGVNGLGGGGGGAETGGGASGGSGIVIIRYPVGIQF
jgi:hypothetical protein